MQYVGADNLGSEVVEPLAAVQAHPQTGHRTESSEQDCSFMGRFPTR
ncbi:hypothetical protein [Streptacidiphilus carbonis]|nr:hypothetical protein [Streptacidiphilus carbonis]